MASIQPQTFGELLRRYRMAAGLTQEELAEQAKLSARAIGALETGERRAPRKDTVALLAKALGLTPAEHALLASVARQRLAGALVQTGVATRTQAPHQPGPPLVGRRQELIALGRHLAGEGPPLFMLAGEPGIGKSRLLEAAEVRAAEQGWTVLSGGCHRRSGQEPYAPFVGVLTHFLATRSPAQQRLDLQGCAWLVRLLPELAERAIGPAPSWTLPAEQERRLMFSAVARFLTNVTGPAGTLLVLDDLHWAGGDALDLLAFLLREPGAQPLRIVGAYRDTDVGPRDPLPLLLGDLTREGLAARTSLPLLEREEARELLTGLLAGEEAGDRASGLPLFLVSWTQELRTGSLSADAALSAMPWSAAESIRQRVAVLPAVAQSVLAAAAVAGRQVSRTTLLAASKASGQHEADTLAGLDAACHARLLAEAPDGSYVFTHDLIRETVLADLGGARRAALHRQVAEALERQPRVERRTAELAWHFAEGDEPARALPYALQAGDQAEVVYAHEEAERQYRLAVQTARSMGDQAREAQALERRADVSYLLGRFHDAHTDLVRAIAIYSTTRNWERLAWATCQRAKVCDQLGQIPESMRFMEELLETLITMAERTGARPAPAPLEGLEARAEQAVSILTAPTATRVLLCLTARLVTLGRFDEVSSLSAAAVRHARQAGDLRMESLIYAFRAIAQGAQGQLDEAMATLHDARRTAEACGDLEALFMALGSLQDIHDLRAEPPVSQQVLLQALEVLRRLGDTSRTSRVLYSLGDNALVLGDWGEARRSYDEAALLVSQIDDAAWQLRTILAHARLDLLEGKGTLMTPGPAEVIRQAYHHPDPGMVIYALQLFAEVELLEDHTGEVGDRVRAVLEDPDVGYPAVGELLALLGWAELQLGHMDQAQAALTQARRRADAQGNRAAYVAIWRIEALLALHQRRWDDATQALDEALRLCRAMPYPYAEAKALYVYGLLHQAKGEPEQAHEKYRAALAILHRLGERLYAERIERALAQLKSRP
jgi:tetratricopeptide (TPR) repeat protein/transcriptional regulator with XRE-family HTH domain